MFSIKGVMIPIDLVSSTTDSIRWSVVLFKPVLVPTSDPKSEFLCQSSSCCAEPADSPEPPCTPGISPTPSSPHITHTVTVLVLSQSTWSRSSAINELNILVAAFLLKPSRTFHSNVTLGIGTTSWQIHLLKSKASRSLEKVGLCNNPRDPPRGGHGKWMFNLCSQCRQNRLAVGRGKLKGVDEAQAVTDAQFLACIGTNS